MRENSDSGSAARTQGGGPRFAYGDMVLFGAFAALFGWSQYETIGIALAAVPVLLIVVATKLDRYPYRSEGRDSDV